MEWFAASDGHLYLLAGEDRDDVRMADTEEARALLRALDGITPAGELPQGGDALGAVRELWELGIVEDAAADEALPDATLTRYEGQLRYFADMTAPRSSRVEPQLRLERSRVVIVGVGGLGSWVALALACAGVGRLDLIDGDRVELGNLNRQMLFRERDLGRPKADVAAERLSAFNSGIDVRPLPVSLDSEEDVRTVVEGADLVVDAADWPPHLIERWIDAACFGAGVPYVAMSQFPPKVRVGPLYVPGRTPCYGCLEAELRRDHPLFDEIVAQRSLRPSPAATFGPACALIGGSVATDVVHQLTGICEPATAGAAIELDLRTMESERRPVPRTRDCARCAR